MNQQVLHRIANQFDTFVMDLIAGWLARFENHRRALKNPPIPVRQESRRGSPPVESILCFKFDRCYTLFLFFFFFLVSFSFFLLKLKWKMSPIEAARHLLHFIASSIDLTFMERGREGKSAV